jgi:hypothetical protein
MKWFQWKNLTSIPFWKCNARKIKRERSWKSHPAKSNLAFCQCWPLAIQNLIYGAKKVQLMQTQLSWIPNSNTYPHSKFLPKKMSYEGYKSFQRWQLNSASKQVSWRNESKLHSKAFKPTSKFLYQKFSSSKSELEDFMQGYFSFLGKIVIEVLKCKLPT